MIKPNFSTATAAEIADYWASPEGQIEWAAKVAAREARDAEIAAAMVAKPRALRPLPASGKVSARYAVIFDGQRVGEILQVRGYGLWYAKIPGQRGLGMDYSSRQAAAESIIRQHVSA